jgi:hypothetical protein
MSKELCRYCGRDLESPEGHRDGCPIMIGTDQAKQEWSQGYNHGFRDEWIPWHTRRYYSATYLLGHDFGADEVETQIGAIMDSR